LLNFELGGHSLRTLDIVNVGEKALVYGKRQGIKMFSYKLYAIVIICLTVIIGGLGAIMMITEKIAPQEFFIYFFYYVGAVSVLLGLNTIAFIKSKKEKPKYNVKIAWANAFLSICFGAGFILLAIFAK
jgi:hypothetical protein